MLGTFYYNLEYFSARFSDRDSKHRASHGTPLSDMSSKRLGDDHGVGSVNCSEQQYVRTKKATLDGDESDITTDDDEFILYIDDDKKHIIK